jgi:hypothetical protein
MSKCERMEFRVRLSKPEAAASVSEVQQVVSTAVAEVQGEVQKGVTKALAIEHGMADLVSNGRYAGFGTKD